MTTIDETLYRVVDTRAGGATQRCHGIRHIGSYSNAEHTFGVLCLLWHLYPERFAEIGPYALAHDVPEFIWGDVPAPTLRNVPGVRELLGRLEDTLNRSLGLPPEGELGRINETSFKILKSCDRLDLWFWCKEQEALGSFYARECLVELEGYFTSDQDALHGRARELWVHASLQPIHAFVPRQARVAERLAGEDIS